MPKKRLFNLALTILAFVLFLVGFFFLIADFKIKLVYILLLALSGFLFALTMLLTFIFNLFEQKENEKLQIHLEFERELFDVEITKPIQIKKTTVPAGKYIFALTKDLKFKLVKTTDFSEFYLILPKCFSKISFSEKTLIFETNQDKHELLLNKNIQEIRNSKSFNDLLYVLNYYHFI